MTTATATPKKTEGKKLRGAMLGFLLTQKGKWVTLAQVFEKVEKAITKTAAIESFNRDWDEPKTPLHQKLERGKVRLIKRAFSDLVYRADNPEKYPDHPVVRVHEDNKQAVDFKKQYMLKSMPKKSKKVIEVAKPIKRVKAKTPTTPLAA